MKLIISSIILFLVLSLAMTSCLKDKDFDNGKIQSVHNLGGDQKIIEMSLTATSNVNFLQISTNLFNRDTSFDLVPITLASASPATEDINVTLVDNDALIGDYNVNNGAQYEKPPLSVYSILNTPSPSGGYVVTIAKGSYVGYLRIKVNPSNYLGHQYAFGYQISSVANSGYTISGNFREGVVAIGIKNKYDGIYDLRIQTIGWTAYGIADSVTGNYPGHFQFITASANGNSIFNPTSGFGNLQPAFTAGTNAVKSPITGFTGFGATTPQFNFDLVSDSLISVVNTTPDDGRGRVLLKNNAVRGSRWESGTPGTPKGTRKIYAAYIMKQNGRPDQFIYDTLTYFSPR